MDRTAFKPGPAGAATSGFAQLPGAPVTPGASDTIALIQSRSLPMLVQQELERMILAGELASGSKLNESAIAERLGVSRGPVREAFRALEESGLVRLEKNRGVFVRQVSLEEADEIFVVRAVLEEWAGRQVARHASAAEIRELKGLVERMERAAERRDVDDYHRLNLEFHDRLVGLAGNGKLRSVYRRLVNELSLYRRTSLGQAGALTVSTVEHRGIVDRIAARSAAGTAKALHDHVMASRERLHQARRSRSTALAGASSNSARERKTR